MKVFGYVRDKDGNFEKRKEKVMSFAKFMDFSVERMICERSTENYEDMIEIKKLLESEKNFVLLVSDTSDLFEDLYSRVMILKILEENNVFLIDTYYPNFDYRMLVEKNCKDNPSGFLTNSFIAILEAYLRKKNSDIVDDAVYSDMRMRFEEWKRNI